MRNEIREAFEEEVKGKRRDIKYLSHRNQHGRGMVFTAVDYLSGVEKRKYTKGSKIVTYNMNEIIPFSEFQHFTKEDQKRYMSHWYNEMEMSWSKIQAGLGMKSNQGFATYRDSLDIKITNPKQLEKVNRMKAARDKAAEAYSPEEYAQRRSDGIAKAKAKKQKQEIERKHEEALIEYAARENTRQSNEEAERIALRAELEAQEKEAERIEAERMMREAIEIERQQMAEVAQQELDEETERIRHTERLRVENERNLMRAELEKFERQLIQREAELQERAQSITSQSVALPMAVGGSNVAYMPPKAEPVTFAVDLEGTGDTNYQRLKALLSWMDRDPKSYRIKIVVEDV